MNLHGAKLSEVIGVINAVTRDAQWTKHGLLFITEGNIAGVTLRVRQTFHEKGLSILSLTGNGWMLSFQVTRQRPRNMADDVASEMVWLFLAPWNRFIDPAEFNKRLCVHTLCIISPDKFQKEMTLLRMFDSEWL
jgi:hypothetical protein